VSRVVNGRESMVAVSDTYLYVATVIAGEGEDAAGRQKYDFGLLIFDVGDATRPALVGGVTDGLDIEYPQSLSIDGLAVDGTHVYALATDGFRAFDISDPARPALIARGPRDDMRSRGLVVRGSYAFVGGPVLSVLDISHPSHPVLIREHFVIGERGEKEYLGAASSGGFAGNRLALADANRLHTFDVSDAYRPRSLGSCRVSTPGLSKDVVAVQGAHAYVVGLNGWTSVDIADPLVPKRDGIVLRLGGFDSIWVRGERAILRSQYALHLGNVSDPRNPRVVDETGYPTLTDGYAIGVAVDSTASTVYLFDQGVGLRTLRVASGPRP
jgi:hypothetical protein